MTPKKAKKSIHCLLEKIGDEPIGYVAWFMWAHKKIKTHRQVKCKDCGLYHIWKLKKEKP